MANWTDNSANSTTFNNDTRQGHGKTWAQALNETWEGFAQVGEWIAAWFPNKKNSTTFTNDSAS